LRADAAELMRVRAPRHDEAEAVLAVIVARDTADIGRPDYLLQDVLEDWRAPGHDIERDVFVAVDDGAQIVGWADVDPRGARVAVHPDHERRGAGTLLRGAVEARMRELGCALRQEVIPANAGAVEHLRAAGYERTLVYQRMRVALHGVPAPPDTPWRRFDLGTEAPAVHALIDTAFREIDGSSPLPYDVWLAEVATRSEPAFCLAIDGRERLAAAAVGERREDGVGYVARLAVAAGERGRGHGRALLLALLDAFRGAGLTAAELGVAGTNAPATRLYESIGMALDFRSEVWELTAPRDDGGLR